MAKGGLAIRRVKSADDRKRGSFLTLKKAGDEATFYLLGKPDPELEDNDGYLEYFEHYTNATGYMPCVGEDCPLCAEGDSPNTRAKIVVLEVPKNDPDPANGEVKVLTVNYSVIMELVDLLSEDEPLLGQLIRFKRLDDRGKYSIRPKSNKLTKTELKKAQTGMPELEKIVLTQAKRVLEEIGAADALEDDDDDDDTTTTGKSASRSSKAKSSGSAKAKAKAAKDDEEEEEEDEDEDEDENEGFDPESGEYSGPATIKAMARDKTTATLTIGDVDVKVYASDDTDLTDFKKGQDIEIEMASDDDDDWVLSSISEPGEEPEDEDEEEEEEEEETTESDVEDEWEGDAVISEVDDDEDTITVDIDGEEVVVFFLADGEDTDGKDWSEFEVSNFKEGDKIHLSIQRDEDGDMVAVTFPKKARATTAKKGGTAKKTTTRKK